jgi:hypothetical protein
METLMALEGMAQTSATADSYFDVDRWMKMFDYTAAQAEKAIEAHFQNLSRIIISNDQWNIMRNNTEIQGHDQESYAHYLEHYAMSPPRHQQPKTPPTSGAKRRKSKQYLFKLIEGLTAVDIQVIARLLQPPRTAVDETDESTFAVVDVPTRAALEKALPPGLVFAPLPTPAEKDLSDFSIAPTLGIDATLPHHRIGTASRPRQDEYPVPYFFYGTLADPDRLIRLLNLNNTPTLCPAAVRRCKTKNWGPYFALVDGTEKDCIQGWVYVVQNAEHEDELRRYESSNYEVVRCEIDTGGKAVPGLTFRFCGDEEMLR